MRSSQSALKGKLLSHVAMGASWESFVIEQLISSAGPEVQPWFYRTSAGAEIDLLLDVKPSQFWAFEIKHSSAPRPAKGFHIACVDVAAARKLVVHSGSRSYRDGSGVSFMPLRAAMAQFRALRS